MALITMLGEKWPNLLFEILHADCVWIIGSDGSVSKKQDQRQADSMREHGSYRLQNEPRTVLGFKGMGGNIPFR
jgi:hypothetical protein